MNTSLSTFGAAPKPSPLRSFVDRLNAVEESAMSVHPYARAGLHALRAGGTSLITGGTLGAIHGRWGLDIQNKYPIDGYLALAGLAATLFLANDQDGLQIEARSIMSVASGIYAFRQGEKWAKGRKHPHAVKTTTQNEEDPILAAAAGLGDVQDEAA